MDKNGTKCCVNVMKYDERDLSLQKFSCIINSGQFHDASTANVTNFGEKSVKGIEDLLQDRMPNFSDDEETLLDVLHPITFVAVPPISMKYEEPHDQQSHSAARDPLLPNPLEEHPFNRDMTKVTNVEEERKFLPDLEIKLEVKEDILVDKTISSEDGFVERSGEVEIKFESICDVSDLKEEKPIERILDLGNFEDNKDKPFAFKEKSEILKSEAEESSFIGYRQDENEKFDLGQENQLEKEEALIIVEIINSPNKVIGTGDNNSEINPRIKENGLKKNLYSYTCSHCDAVFSSKQLYDQYLSSHLSNMNHVSPAQIASEYDLQEFEQSPYSAIKIYSLNIDKVSFNCTEQLDKWNQIYIRKITFSCPICKKPFCEKIIVDSNSQNQNGFAFEKRFHCGICENSFFVKSNLYAHMRSHSSEKRLQCDVCEKSFFEKSKFDVHMRTHTGGNPYKCGICDQSFSVKCTKKRHNRLYSGGKTISCRICNKSFTEKSALKEHMHTHSDVKAFACGVCEKLFSFKSGIALHMLSHTAEKPYGCDICLKSFSQQCKLKVHMRSHTGEKPFTCGFCNKSFADKSVLKVHLRSHTRVKPFACGICGKSFCVKPDLTKHMGTHTGIKPFGCGVCGKSFCVKPDLTKHIRIHTRVKPFADKSALNIHMQIYPGDKPFACDVCEKSFSLRCLLTKHMRIHSAEKPHACDICFRSFTEKYKLKVHLRSHTGEKPFTCGICNKSFADNSIFKVHLRYHSGIKPFVCSICNKSFCAKQDLYKHMRTHSGEKPFTCDVCSKTFATASGVRKHQRTQH